VRAAVYRRFGGPDVVAVEDLPNPVPAADELLIRVHASTVSAADRRSRSKDVPSGLGLPSSLVLGLFRPRRRVLGMDVSGVVVAVGSEVRGFETGDEVIAMLGSRFGGHAEYAIARATDAIVPKPRGLGFDEAVAIVFGGLTAQAFLNQVDVTRGSRVLVNGASGAVGSAVVQLAHAVGAYVVAVTSRENRELVTSLGADEVIDYREQDFAANGQTYDVVVDCVGNAPVDRVGPSVDAGGAVLLIVADLRSLMTAKNDARRWDINVITGPGPYRAEDLGYVARLAEDGSLRPVIDRAYALDDVADAHRFVDTGRKRGSVILSIATADRTVERERG
jgi:NADPH:quinone reductase-like Zn-dependent oxidoreductase